MDILVVGGGGKGMRLFGACPKVPRLVKSIAHPATPGSRS